MLAVHGTHSSAEQAVGLGPPDYMHAFGERLADHRLAVWAPDIITQYPDQRGDANMIREAVDRRARAVGERLLGIEVGALASAAGAFRQRLRLRRAGVYGISLGGLIAQYLGAADPSMRLTVISQYAADRERTLVGLDAALRPWWLINDHLSHLTGTGHLRRYTDETLARLIAPRYLILEAGERDYRAAAARRMGAAIRRDYQRLGVSTRVRTVIGPGLGHEPDTERTVPLAVQMLTR